MSALTGTTSSSNTMVPGNDGHHDSKIKDSNMEDRYKLKCCTILFVSNRAFDVWYGHHESSNKALKLFICFDFEKFK